jgi:hypothetical protein
MTALGANKQIATRQEGELSISQEGKASHGLQFTRFVYIWVVLLRSKPLHTDDKTNIQIMQTGSNSPACDFN